MKNFKIYRVALSYIMAVVKDVGFDHGIVVMVEPVVIRVNSVEETDMKLLVTTNEDVKRLDYFPARDNVGDVRCVGPCEARIV